MLNLIFLAVAWHKGLLGHPGLHIVLAATNGVGALVNAATLYRGLRKQQVLRASPGWPALLVRTTARTRGGTHSSRRTWTR